MLADPLWKQSVITRLLAQYGKSIKKSLGQHYLIDAPAVEKIAQTVMDQLEDETKEVIEIGPGLGVITQAVLNKLMASSNNLILSEIKLRAVEIDSCSISILKQNFREELENEFLQIEASDILNWHLSDEKEAVIYGNLPYQISSQIFFKLCESWYPQISAAVFMVQKEVAERLRAGSNNKTYGVLTVILGYFFELSKVVTLGPKVFYPPPRVDSEVILLKRVDRKAVGRPILEEGGYSLFRELVKGAFHNRRKKVLNSVEHYFSSPTMGKKLDKDFVIDHKKLKAVFNELELGTGLRGENLTTDDFVRASNLYDRL